MYFINPNAYINLTLLDWYGQGVDGFNLVGYEGLQPAVGDANHNLVLKLRELTDKAGEEQGT